MPRVNIKYKLEIDATVTAVDHVKFEGENADLNADQKSPTLYEGKVKNKFVDATLFLSILLGGFAGKWSLEVSVRRVNHVGEETGDWKKLKTFPIEGEISKSNQRKGRYQIDW